MVYYCCMPSSLLCLHDFWHCHPCILHTCIALSQGVEGQTGPTGPEGPEGPKGMEV